MKKGNEFSKLKARVLMKSKRLSLPIIGSVPVYNSTVNAMRISILDLEHMKMQCSNDICTSVTFRVLVHRYVIWYAYGMHRV